MRRSAPSSGQTGGRQLSAAVQRGRLCLGLMSGTSMDGIDAALVEISGPSAHPQVRLKAFDSQPYPAALRNRLMRVASGGETTAAEISELNFQVGEVFARAARVACRNGGASLNRLAVIGSHGQTVFHRGKTRPALGALRGGATTPCTLQIGEPAVIAERTGACVVGDFRTADVAAGGEGAPLVPLVDYLLLRDARMGTIALNLGGIANVTVIPPAARREEVLGFDTGPGNMVIDAVVTRATHGQASFDPGGRSASRGTIDEHVLNGILRMPFFRRPPPKSTGREQFGPRFVDRFFSARGKKTCDDLVATATELTARSIALAIRKFVPLGKRRWRMVVSGGGAHNCFLLARLAAHLPLLPIQLSDVFGLPVDAKEAIAFALLADRTLHGLPGNLPRVTGARRCVVLGKIVRP